MLRPRVEIFLFFPRLNQVFLAIVVRLLAGRRLSFDVMEDSAQQVPWPHICNRARTGYIPSLFDEKSGKTIVPKVALRAMHPKLEGLSFYFLFFVEVLPSM